MALVSEKRICTVQSPFGPDALILTKFSGRERVSGLFEFECQFTSEDPNLDFDSIVGQAMRIETKMADDQPRYFHGVVANFAQTDTEGSNVVYRARLVPWLWFLTLRNDCRVFPQDKYAIELVEMVFDELGLSDYDRSAVQGPHDRIPFCVQYRESSFDFVSRLLEREGIHYYFRHDADRHVMVLSDSPNAPECPGQPKASYEALARDQATAGQVTAWHFEQQMRSGKYTHTDYNFRDPSLDLCAETITKHPVGRNKTLEVYDHPGNYGGLGAGKSIADLRMEAEEAALRRIDGASTCYGFTPGFSFELAGHYRESFNGKYLVTAVSHRLEQGLGTNASAARYENTFSCMPYAIPYRPPLVTDKPTIKGVQTAVVVGEPGKEIDIDEYGSVYVQFHWDRLHTKNPQSSCRVRVGTAWAGKEWGFFSAPRIGQEVIVEFLEGDPDRPLVTGLAYNAEQKPPYQGGTQSGIRTRTTPNGGPSNFNELRFEDQKGEEQIFVHAERNVDVRVKKDRFEWIGEDTHLIVKKDQYEQVENERHTKVGSHDVTQVDGDRHLTVTGKQAIAITGSRSLTVTGDAIEVFQGNHSEQTSQSLYIKAMGIVIEAMTGITIKTGASSVVIDPTGVTLTGPMVTVDGQIVRIASGPGSPPTPGLPGRAVPPIAPKPPEEADEADPGEVGETKAQQRASGTGKYGAAKPKPFKPPADEATGSGAKRTWIEIELKDEQGKPVPGEPYEVTLPDGATVASGTLDEKGFARVEGIDPGTCKITFPRLDKDAWKKA